MPASNELLAETSHRPWPVPDAPWVIAMRWEDVLFAHWRVSADALRELLPTGLTLDLFDDAAWLGITPLRMTGVRMRGLPPLPGVSDFPELNVRTYVIREGKPGVWFFSLDTTNPLAVRAARLGYSLPYFDARMSVRRDGNEIIYESVRTHQHAAAATFRARYRPAGGPSQAERGSLDYWLIERYCLYSADRQGGLWRAEIHHLPWPLQPAVLKQEENTMAQQLGLKLVATPLVHYVRELDVVAWMISST